MTGTPGTERGGRRDYFEESEDAAKRLHNANLRYVEAAAAIVRLKYPLPHRMFRETPTIELRGDDRRVFEGGRRSLTGKMTPDIAVFDGDRMCAVVEVGNLTRPDKLQLLSKYLPGVDIWWMPYSDLMSFYNNGYEYEKHRLIPLVNTEGIKTVANIEFPPEKLHILSRDTSSTIRSCRELPNKQLLRPDEVAALFGVSTRTIRHWIRDGKLEYIRPSDRTIRIYRSDVEKMLDEIAGNSGNVLL